MSTMISGVQISPVNMDDRKNLGIKPGDTVRVHQKIHDKEKVRLQMFEGLVLACKHGAEAGSTFTVRKVSSGVGVEKIFPLYSPNIDKIEIVKRSKVRQAKLYYIREKVAREIKRQMRRMMLVDLTTESDIENTQKAAAAAKEAEAKAVAAEETVVAEAKPEATDNTEATNSTDESDNTETAAVETKEPETQLAADDAKTSELAQTETVDSEKEVDSKNKEN